MTTLIHIAFDLLVGFSLVILFLYHQKKQAIKIQDLENQVEHLSLISEYFPEFISRGEDIAKNISEDLSLKQEVLKKLILEAEKSSMKLGVLEEKIKEHKLNKDTIDKILILVNHGFTPNEISPKLNIPVGEIELVVKLKRYLNAPIKERL